MSTVIFKGRSVRMDLTMKKKYLSFIVGRIINAGLRYKAEKEVKIGSGEEEWVKITDVEGPPNRIVYLISKIDAQSYTSGDNFYITICTRKGKKNARKNRKKAGTWSNSGDRGEEANPAV